MHARTHRAGVAAAALLAGAVTAGAADMTSSSAAAAANPLLAPWSGPYAGVPPFDKVRPEHLGPALEAAMAENLAEVDRIANDPAAPTFENTIAAMERTGRTLDRASTVYGIFVSNLNDDAVQAVEREMAPKLAAFSDKITQNAKLFSRIAAVYETRETAGLTPEQQRLTWLYYTNFVRAGAKLDPAAKEKLSGINQRLATLYTKFSQNVLADEDEQMLRARRRGRPRRPAGVGARRRGHRRGARDQKGKWAIAEHALEHRAVPHLFRPPRSAREGVAHVRQPRRQRRRDTTTTRSSPRSSQLRAERAKLLGYPTHAHWRLENTMAKTPERAMELMEAVWTPAVARVREEVADMQAVADQEKARHQDRALGLPLLRREGAQGEVRPRRERGQALPAAREAARRHVLGGRRSCSASRSSRSSGTCPSSIPTCASGKSTIRPASTSGSGTSIPTRARASAPARG